MTETKQSYRFRRHDSIGAADAESDLDYLSDCFVDTGDLSVLRNCSSPRRILIGRTGVGKSALLSRLRSVEEHVIQLAPEVLALNYLTNSTILRFFEDLGVQLDPFYTLLWRHIFTVELIRHKFKIINEEKKSEFLSWVSRIFQKDKGKQKALGYLEEWGSHFWEETEYRIKEFTTKLERELSAEVSASPLGVDASAGAAQKLSEEQKQEVVQRAQRVVSGVQIKDLHEILRLLEEDVFDDPQERHYIVIDRLDENWVDDRIRYKLLRALLEGVRAFQQIKCVKIIVVMRADLVDRVFSNTRDSGFQEEKYESLILRLKWSKSQLEELLDRRISKLIRRQYTAKAEVRVAEVLPDSRKKQAPLDYILERTFYRPREAILFVNECLSKAEGKVQITWQNIQTAEVEYSRRRLRSLADEWHTDFPRLPDYTKILVRRRSPFFYKAVTQEEMDKFLVVLLDQGLRVDDPICNAAQQYFDNKITGDGFLNLLFRTLYQIGVIGIKPDTVTATQWSHLNYPSLTAAQIGPDVQIHVHPTFWTVLGTIRD
jgi:hypothetical protein